jgi:hypothetical protein
MPASKIGKAAISALAMVAIWWVGHVTGAVEQVPVLEARVALLEKQLDRIESKLDLLVEAAYGKQGLDRLRAVPGAVPERPVRAASPVPEVRD